MVAQRLHNRETGFADAWNFGPIAPCDTTVAEFVDLFAEAWGNEQIAWQTAVSPLAETAELRLDSQKAVSSLAWQPLVPQVNAIRETASWYRSFLVDKADPLDLCNQRLDQFLDDWANAESGASPN